MGERQIPGVASVHELHIWRLDQHKSIASAHVIVDDKTVGAFAEKAKIIMECLHAYGIHSATLQPEEALSGSDQDLLATAPGAAETEASGRRRRRPPLPCQLMCSKLCGQKQCCTPGHGKK